MTLFVGQTGFLSSVLSSGLPQCPAGLATDLVGYWKLDETSGTTAADSAGANDGTLNNMDGATDWVTGKLNNGLDFDGSDDFVAIANEANFDFDVADTFSIACWMKLRTQADSTQDTLVSKGVESASDFVGYDMLISHSGAQTGQLMVHLVSVWPNAIQVHGDTIDLDDDTWHHVAATYDGSGAASGVALYVDGSAESLTTISDDVGASILNDSAVRLGARGDLGNPTDGALDDVRIYSRELTAGEVGDLYNSGTGCES